MGNLVWNPQLSDIAKNVCTNNVAYDILVIYKKPDSVNYALTVK